MFVPIINLARRRLAAAARVHNGAVRACLWCCGLALLMASGACGAGGTDRPAAAPPLVVCARHCQTRPPVLPCSMPRVSGCEFRSQMPVIGST